MYKRQGGGGERNPRFGPRVTISCAPVEVGPILKRVLFHPPAEQQPDESDSPPPDTGDLSDPDFSEAPPPRAPAHHRAGRGIILTSATLATRTAKEGEHREHAEAAFSHIMSRLGIDDATTIQLGSPFDYARQARVIIDLSMPNPTSRVAESAPGNYNEALAARVLYHIRSTRGGAFVLFTSFSTLHAVAEQLRDTLEEEGMPVFVHGGRGGRDGSRQQILKQFSENNHAVLFGAASFWQGVDVRGERLRNVIITRLPFEPPDRPLTQARLERIETSGGNPFMQDSLPRAIIRFKQGFGRLIRSKSDTGRVVVLDPRIRTARYGKLFLDALPEGVRIEEVREERFDD